VNVEVSRRPNPPSIGANTSVASSPPMMRPTPAPPVRPQPTFAPRVASPSRFAPPAAPAARAPAVGYRPPPRVAAPAPSHSAPRAPAVSAPRASPSVRVGAPPSSANRQLQRPQTRHVTPSQQRAAPSFGSPRVGTAVRRN
jgi:hypothetical protein